MPNQGKAGQMANSQLQADESCWPWSKSNERSQAASASSTGPSRACFSINQKMKRAWRRT